MFKKTGVNTVESSDGYSVRIATRHEIHYREAGITIAVPIEPMAGGDLIVSISLLSAPRKESVKCRIADALAFLGVNFVFD